MDDGHLMLIACSLGARTEVDTKYCLDSYDGVNHQSLECRNERTSSSHCLVYFIVI